MRGLFVTGTDTGVGKTVITAALAAGLRAAGRQVGVMKPVETGCAREGGELRAADAEYLAERAGSPDPGALICPCRYESPLAPAAAARLERRPVDLDAIRGAHAELRRRHPFLLVEGAGGAAVPLTDDLLLADLAAEFGYALLVVARAGLGTLNHTLLTLELARGRGVLVFGIVLNRYPREPGLAERTNPEELRRRTGLRVWCVPDTCLEPEPLGGAVRAAGLLPDLEAALDAPG
jgi:dethiobiotin synthetase